MFEVIHARRETATPPPGWAPVFRPLCRNDIAGYLGLNAETVNRIFSKLKMAGPLPTASPAQGRTAAFRVPLTGAHIKS